jgi:tetratricopeptide (TPR) repeat protein
MIRVLIPLLIIASLFACSNESASTNDSREPIRDGHSQMIFILDSIARYSNPLDNYSMNAARAKHWEIQVAKAGTPQEWVSLQFKMGLELLNAGKTESAIVALEKVIDKIENELQMGLNQNTKAIYEMQALAYLRMGEQANCIQQHNSASCIIPLQPEGYHKFTRGSERAVQLYENILNAFPDDRQSQWLLNIAYMTLGGYPEKVPGQYLIPANHFSSGVKNFQRFEEVAIQNGVAEIGLSGGVSFEDFDNDGLLDLFTTSYGLSDPCHLYRNTGDGFEDVSDQAGLSGITGGLNTIHADYNNDGYTDILILRGAWFNKGGYIPNSLLRNNGDGTFTDVTIEAGLLSYHPTQAGCWADFNNDGWLDLYIGNETTEVEGETLRHPNELYINNQDGTFRETAVASGVATEAWVKGVTAGDINNDKWVDIYVSMPGVGNKLFVNQGVQDGILRFVEYGGPAGVQQPSLSFPAWMWDYNNDGWTDIFAASYDVRKIGYAPSEQLNEFLDKQVDAQEIPRLYLNNGDGTFSDQTQAAGVDKVMFAMGCNFGDLNNDGYLDFYIGTGTPDLRSVVPNRMFLNKGNGAFSEVTMDGFGHIQKGHGIAFADYDNDGDEDIYCVMGGAYEGDVSQNVLFQNTNQNNNWICLRLEGVSANKSAIGARVRVDIKEKNGRQRSIYRTVNTGGSFGAGSLQQEIGIGTGSVEKLEIQWPGPDFKVQVFEEVENNRFIRIKQDTDKLVYENRNMAG